MASVSKYNLIIPVGMKPKPTQIEERVAELVAEYFRSDVRFIERASSTTPDIQILKTGQRWEIKNIRGNSKNTIQTNLRRADNQSENVVICLSETEMRSEQAESRIRFHLKSSHVRIKRIILITKSEKIIEIK
ncbi:MAG: hypothetical protein LBM12_00730 [Candidatus Nomurabacteria bacterium]|jgi:hypothetical protein|nr:hypothetical protein [Candidatus Nomurabacteria bacterium]